MDEKPASSWDDLIREIGAKPAPDATERKRPAIETRFESAVPPPPAPKPKPGDWNALAGELGVEASEPPPRPAASPSLPDLEASFASITPIESEFESIVKDEIADVEFLGDSPEAEAEEGPASRGGDDDDSDTLSGEAARSAFEALFDAGSFAALPQRPRPPRPPRRTDEPRGPQWRDTIDDGGQELHEHDQPGERGPRRDDEAESEEARRGEDREPARRRRRRRRGRGREREDRPPRDADAPPREEGDRDEGDRDEGDRDEDWSGESDASASAAPAEHDDADSAEDRDKSGRRRHPRGRRRSGAREDAPERTAAVDRNGRSPASDDDDQDEDDDALLAPMSDDGDDDEEGDEGPAGRAASHKNIPTWSEAIGVMVETNMQSRKNSPQRPSGDRGRDRGRGRGGRGRGRGRGGGGSRS